MALYAAGAQPEGWENAARIHPLLRQKVEHPLLKVRRFLVGAVAKAGIHMQPGSLYPGGDLPGGLRAHDPVAFPADDQHRAAE